MASKYDRTCAHCGQPFNVRKEVYAQRRRNRAEGNPDGVIFIFKVCSKACALAYAAPPLYAPPADVPPRPRQRRDENERLVLALKRTQDQLERLQRRLAKVTGATE